jgi:hypothetical protein
MAIERVRFRADRLAIACSSVGPAARETLAPCNHHRIVIYGFMADNIS